MSLPFGEAPHGARRGSQNGAGMQFTLDLAIVLAGLFAVGQFAWGMRYHFVAERLPLGSKIITAVSTATTVLYLYLQFAVVQPVLPMLIGLAMAVASSALFTWAVRTTRAARLLFVYDEGQPHQLLREGPYRHLRHPFYTSYVLLWAGWGLATWSPFVIPSVVALTALYVYAARGEEAKFARSEMAEEYARYRRETGFFWPRFNR